MLFFKNVYSNCTCVSAEMMATMFTAALSPRFTKLRRLVQEKGSAGLDEKGIKQMLKEYPELLDNEASIGEWKDKKEKARANIDDIIKELRSNAADTLADEKRNMEKFERKFLMKIDEMKSAVQEIVIRESDRVISTVITAVALGPKGIIDKVRMLVFTHPSNISPT